MPSLIGPPVPPEGSAAVVTVIVSDPVPIRRVAWRGVLKRGEAVRRTLIS